MSGADGIVRFPWLRDKAGFLQSNFKVPDSVARPIIDLTQKGYKFTDRFLREVAASTPLQKLFTEGRIANAADSIGFPPEVIENLCRKLSVLIVVEKKTFDLREKSAGAPPAKSSSLPAGPYAPSPASRAEQEIKAAKEIPLAQIALLQPQEIINQLRSAWQGKDSLSFLVAFIKLMRFSFSRSKNEDVKINLRQPDLNMINEAMQGEDPPGFSMNFFDGTAGERWSFKSRVDPDKPYLVYVPSDSSHDYSGIFRKALAGCSGLKFDQGKYLYIHLE